MRYQQDLQVALRERYRRLMTTQYQQYAHEVGLINDWMLQQGAIRSLLAEIDAAEPEVSAEEWIESLRSARGFSWTTRTEAGRARLVWALMQHLATLGEQAPLQFGHAVSSERNINAVCRDLTTTVIEPLFNYLSEQIGAESSVLYLLERWVRRVEWFTREELYERYKSDTRMGEMVYDADLRQFLFDQGVNMPFSQPKSASGLSDVIGELDTEDPLVCEVKLFDAHNHGKREVAGGVNQVVHYAQDYGKQTGYLMIVNLSGRSLAMPTDGSEKQWPRYLDIAGVRVHLITVRALPVPSASKLGKSKPVTVTRREMVDPDASTD